MSTEKLTHDEARDGVISRDAEDRPVVTFERKLAHPVARVWAALTDSTDAAGWLGLLRLEPRVGGDVELSPGTEPGQATEIAKGSVTAFDPPHLLEYWLDTQGTRGHLERHVLRWALREDEEGCVLTFSNAFEPAGRASNSIICGWHDCLDQLEQALAGRPVNWQTRTRDRVVELYWHYRNKPRP